MVKNTYLLRLAVWVCLLSGVQHTEAQIIDLGNGQKVDCEYASGNLEVALCLRHQIEQAENKLDSLYQRTLKVLDSLSVSSDRFKRHLKEDGVDQAQLEKMTDYRKMKQLVIRSHAIYLEYVDLEKKISGEEIGDGRNRVTYENARTLELLNSRVSSMTKKLLDFQ